MTTWIALFRGINVGGNNRLTMDQLRADLESLGCRRVETYIQSGNVVFQSASRSVAVLGSKIAQRIQSQHQFEPRVLLLSPRELQQAIDQNPFPQATDDPKSLHFFFLEGAPTDPDLDALAAVKAPTEAYCLVGRVFYLHAPAGIGRSKLAAIVERKLGVVATARNYRTVGQLATMAAKA
ncbi:DUF1697 domain-containing protein [Lignipirellula cremea]|uniref:DUF1697 domain-containing protein n=1 Tax=Lignipirellula cremea TaxID=2528010 RepID=A0A518DZL6_9BACT|nr:DUF1697 domain-containing protein [Lignipirellula cremea]QDU97290.1 hypothetical protein Pla8534_51360 [Lignipirellula cremea]